MFDQQPAAILRADDNEIVVYVPLALAGRSSANVSVVVDGHSSLPRAITFAPAAPAVFPGGIINQDATPNGIDKPAPAGSTVALYATGVFSTGVESVRVKIHDREMIVPRYAGQAPGYPGVHQVNVTIPEDLPAMTTEIVICSNLRGGAGTICGTPSPLTISTPEAALAAQ
jgi:uncharacterized protein (TIGR03437 family)